MSGHLAIKDIEYILWLPPCPNMLAIVEELQSLGKTIWDVELKFTYNGLHLHSFSNGCGYR